MHLREVFKETRGCTHRHILKHLAKDPCREVLGQDIQLVTFRLE